MAHYGTTFMAIFGTLNRWDILSALGDCIRYVGKDRKNDCQNMYSKLTELSSVRANKSPRVANVRYLHTTSTIVVVIQWHICLCDFHIVCHLL